MIIADTSLRDLVRGPDSWLPSLRAAQTKLLRTSLSSMECDSFLLISPTGFEFSLPLWTGQAFVDWQATIKSDGAMRRKFRADLKSVGKTPSTIWWGLLGYEDDNATAPGRVDPRIAQPYLVPKALGADFIDVVEQNAVLQKATIYAQSARRDIRHPMRDISEGCVESALIQSVKAQMLLSVWPDGDVDADGGPLAYLQREAQREAEISREALGQAVSRLKEQRSLDLRPERFGISGALVSWPCPHLLGSSRRMGEEVVSLRAEFVHRFASPHFFFQLGVYEPANNNQYQSLHPVDMLVQLCTLMRNNTPMDQVLMYMESMKSSFPVLASNPFANKLPGAGAWHKPQKGPLDSWIRNSAVA